MGNPFPSRWKAARDEVLALPDPCLPFGRFADICTRHGLDPQALEWCEYPDQEHPVCVSRP
jgi:hypothetical protein